MEKSTDGNLTNIQLSFIELSDKDNLSWKQNNNTNIVYKDFHFYKNTGVLRETTTTTNISHS